MRIRRATTHALTLVSVAGIAAAQAPLFEATGSYRSGQLVSGGVGIINSPFFFPNGGTGIHAMDVLNDGTIFARAELQAAAYEDIVLLSSNGLNAILEGDNEDFFSGSCGSNIPCRFHVLENLYRAATNNPGDRVYVMDIEGIGPGADDETGIFWGTSSAIILEGDTLSATGLSAGTTAGTINTNTFISLNDSRQLLVSMDVIENGSPVHALLRFDLDASGTVTGTDLIAKVGGPVGPGPATWTDIARTVNSQAMNNAGSVLFSGRSSDGTSGLYLDGAFVATEGGAAPGGATWDILVGQPVDLSNSGTPAFRGVLEPAIPGTWVELGDAGDTLDTANESFGSGVIELIAGSLTDEHDVDFYLVRIDDPASFSATTTPVNGSIGATFDSVLYLLEPTHNFNGVSRIGLSRNDDAAPGVIQSTVTGQHIPVGDGNYGPNYILAVATNKATPLASDNNAISEQPLPRELWNSTPRDLLIHDGVLYWQDVGVGAIRRVNTTTAAALPALVVSDPPSHPYSFDDAFLLPGLTVDPVGDRLYYREFNTFSSNIVRTALDGSGRTVLIDSNTSPTDIDFPEISDIHFDASSGMLFLTDLQHGEVWRTDEDGDSPEAIFDEPILAGGSLSFDEIAVDTVAAKVYTTNPITGDLNRSNPDGTGLSLVASNTQAAELAVDPAGRRLFWTEPNLGRIMVLDLTSDAVSVLASGLDAPLGIAHEASSGTLFWSSRVSGDIHQVPDSGGSSSVWFMTDDTEERTADSPVWSQQHHGRGWAFDGDPGATDLMYEITLTGAEFTAQSAAISRNNTQLVARAGVTAATIGTDDTPIRISDQGDIVWQGRTGTSSSTSGIYFNANRMFDGSSPVQGLPDGVIYNPGVGTQGLGFSDDGGYVILRAFNGSFVQPDGYAPGDISILLEITGSPSCNPADLAEPFGLLDLSDITTFVSGFIAQDPASDLDSNGMFDLSDITAFVTAFTAGCP